MIRLGGNIGTMPRSHSCGSLEIIMIRILILIASRGRFRAPLSTIFARLGCYYCYVPPPIIISRETHSHPIIISSSKCVPLIATVYPNHHPLRCENHVPYLDFHHRPRRLLAPHLQHHFLRLLCGPEVTIQILAQAR